MSAANIGLGIDQYTWRSRDDAKVRHSHAQYDDQIFDWGSPPEGGHPGQGYNCRCFAQPLVINEPEYARMSDAEFAHAISESEWEGQDLAAEALIEGIAESVVDLAKLAINTFRYAELRDREDQGRLNANEVEELQQMRDAIQAGVSEISTFVENIPEIAQAFLDHRRAVIDRADVVSIAYLEGLATEGQLRDAHRDRGYLQGTILSVGNPPIYGAV